MVTRWKPNGRQRRWLDKAETDAEKRERMRTDFLCYCDHDGLFADFHGLRQLFNSSLKRGSVEPWIARMLPWHSDIRFTRGPRTCNFTIRPHRSKACRPRRWRRNKRG